MRVMYRLAQIVIIAVLATIAYNNIYSLAIAQPTAESPPIYPAVYIGPTDGDTVVKGEVRRANYVAKVENHGELVKFLQEHPDTAIIYINSQKFKEVDAKWLQKQYQKGVAVVAINVPIHPLATALGEEILPSIFDGKEIPVTDLPLRPDAVIVSIIHPVFSETTNDIIGWGWHSDYYREFDTLPQLINTLLQGNHKK